MPTIDEIRNRLAAATAGPWVTEGVMNEALHDIILGYQVPEWGNPVMVASVWGDDDPLSHSDANANARFIAHAPADIAFLLAEVEGLQLMVEWCETAVEVVQKHDERLRGVEVLNAIRAAVEEEREACAKLAESTHLAKSMGHLIAAKIRERGKS